MIIIILPDNSFIKSLYIDIQKRVKSKKKTYNGPRYIHVNKSLFPKIYK